VTGPDPEKRAVAGPPTPTGSAALVAALAAFPEELGRTLADRPAEALTRPASDGGWGVVENVCHLRDWEAIFLARARAMVDGVEPALPAYDDELWAIERDYRGDDPWRALAEFAGQRAELVRVLEGLPADGWQRRGRHEHHGEISIGWLAEEVRRHDEGHLAQIREALA